MGAQGFLASFLILLASIAAANAHNITEMLSHFPEYSVYNSYLTQTKLADEINSRQTLTCLVLNNAAMTALAQKHPLSVIKSILELHTVLDYFDAQKLHDISDGTTLSTTLYQTTGKADGNFGFVNITDLKGGKVAFGPAAPGSKLDSTYTKTVKTIPYNISVIEISAPILAPGILAAPAPTVADVNITALLEKAGCKTFAALIVSSGVLKTYQNAVEKGLTIFAPNDEAFKAAGAPVLAKLTSAEMVALLQYHAVPEYRPEGSLKTSRAPISTLASSGAGKYLLTTTKAGDEVTLHTGVDSSRLANTVFDGTPLCIFTVDNLLLPSEIFGASPAPSPALVPVSSPSPTPVATPVPAPSTAAPSPEPLSPPAPPTASPVGSPAEAPGPSTAEDSRSTASSALDVKAPVVVQAAFLLFSSLALMLSV
ncbi:envelope glycoprotein [Asimina triloba]